MNILIILEANSISYMVARQLVSVLQGYRNKFEDGQENVYIEITPVIIHNNNEPLARRIATVFSEYSKVATVMQAFSYCGVFIGNTQIIPIKNPYYNELNRAENLLIDENINLREAFLFSQSLQSLKAHKFDKIITFVSVADSKDDNLPLAVAALALFKDSNLFIVCQCNGDISDRIKKLASIANKQIALTGYLDCSHHYKGFAALQTTCMLFKSFIDMPSLPFIAGSRKDTNSLNYLNKDLFFSQCSLALFRVAIISFFIESLDNNNLKKLQERIGLSDAIWNNSATKKAFEMIAFNYNNWCAEAKGYESCLSEEMEKLILRHLNEIKKLHSTASTDVKINELGRCLHECEKFFAPLEDIPELSIELLNNEENQDFNNELSPTVIFETCNSAFSQPDDIEKMRIRTAILDCWEKYYRKYPYNSHNKLSIDKLSAFFSISEAGKRIINGEWVYSDMLQPEVKWITSPYTGFAVFFNDSYIVSKELKDRSEDFRKFMLCYINLFGNQFSKDFKNYITTSAQGTMDMANLTTTSLFKSFKKFTNCKLDINK